MQGVEQHSCYHLQLKVKTFLTDLYCQGKWYIELRTVQDTEADPPRGIFLRVTPLGDPSNSTVQFMQTDAYGRVSYPDGYWVVPDGFVGDAPRFFRNRLDQGLKFDLLQDALANATIYIEQERVLEVRPWTRLH